MNNINQIKIKIDQAIIDYQAGKTVESFYITKHLWFDGQHIHDSAKILEGADPYSVRELAGGLTIADNKHFWRFGNLVTEADGKSFKCFNGIDGIYAKDDFHAFIGDRTTYKIIEGADPKTFKSLDFGFAKDDKNFFAKGKLLDGIGKKYELNKCGFLIGESVVYHYDFKLPIDRASFEQTDYEQKLTETNPFLGNFTISDKNGTYELNFNGREHKFNKIG